MNAVLDVDVKGLQWSDDGHATLSDVLLDKALELDGIIRGWAAEFGATLDVTYSIKGLTVAPM